MPCSERFGAALLASGLMLAAGFAPPVKAAAPARARSGECPTGDTRVDGLLAQIRAQEESLARRERVLLERERTDAAAREAAELRLQELEALRVRVEEHLARLEAATDERVARLADLYARMPAERAAAVIDALDPDLAARIVARMRRPRAAGVLAALPDARAAELSRRILRPREPGASTPLAEAPAEARRTGPGAASLP